MKASSLLELDLDWRQALLANREKALEQLYAETFPLVLQYIKLNNGTAEDAKDIFHDALVIFYEKILLDQLTLTAAASTYLMGICKNLWRRELEKRQRKIEQNGDSEEATLEMEIEVEGKAWELTLLELVEQLGEKCKSILVSFYYLGQKMEQISQQLAYRNVHTASVQKFKCLERLRKTIPTNWANKLN